MQYVITFLEGIISFLSPCMLPMLPVYISYFAGEQKAANQAAQRAVAFVLGFTIVFTSLGLFAGALGTALSEHRALWDITCGALVIVFGLSYLDVIRIPFFKGIRQMQMITGVLSAFLFGMVYSISLTPCVGAFLGSALMLASSAGGAVQGMLLLLVYSLGLGVPFVVSAILIDKLKTTFDFIKRHYKIINTICGGFLIVIGILMAFGLLNSFFTIVQGGVI